MPGVIHADDFSQQFSDLEDEVRRLRRAGAASQKLLWEYDTFTITGSSDTAHTLSYLPYGINVVLLNGLGLVEGTDYSCDYTTGVVTVTATLTAGDVLHVRYVTTGELKVYATPADVGALASDTFTRADSTSLGTTEGGGFTWQTTGSGFSIASNALSCGMAVGVSEVAYIDVGVSDCTISWTYTTIEANSGVAFRMVDASNLWRHEPGTGFLWKRVGGADTSVATGLTASAGQTVSVTLSGSTITFTIAGVAHTPITGQTFNQTATKHGVFGHTSGAVFDNLVVMP